MGIFFGDSYTKNEGVIYVYEKFDDTKSPFGFLYLNMLMNLVHTVISRTIVTQVQSWSQRRNRHVPNQ